MQLATKKCILAYSGAVVFAFGFTLMAVGKDYFSNPIIGGTLNPPMIVRAVPHWCGILLILLGARNFTFGLAQWKYGMNCCGNGACEVIFVNFLALIVSLAAAGLPVYSSYDYLSAVVQELSLTDSPEFIMLISMWFMGLTSAILSLLCMCAGCLPVGSQEMEEDQGLEMQPQYGHDNTQFNKY